MRKLFFCLSLVFAVMVVMIAVPKAQAQVNLTANFWKLVAERNWINARTLAKIIDKRNNQGDIFLAYTDAAAALHKADCVQASELASIVVRFAPGFLPAYDIIAACLIRDGRQRDAETLITNVSNRLNEGPDKDYYLRWAKQLQEVYEPTIDFSMSVTPSSNTNNATSAEFLDTGGFFGRGRINDRAKKGVSIFSRVNIVQPLMQKHNSSFGITLAPGLSYDTVSRINFPSLTGSIYKTRSLSPTQLVSSSIIFSKTLRQNRDFLFRRGLSLSYTNQLRPDLTWTSNMFLFNNNYNRYNEEDNNQTRDSSSVDVSTSFNKVIDQDDKISLIIGASKNDAVADSLDEIEQNITLEWQHRFESGLITSLGGGGGKRRFGDGSCNRGLPSCGNKNRTDYFHSLTIGFSHQDITIGDVRPQLTYQMTNQKSNSIFSDFESHGATVVFRKRF